MMSRPLRPLVLAAAAALLAAGCAESTESNDPPESAGSAPPAGTSAEEREATPERQPEEPGAEAGEQPEAEPEAEPADPPEEGDADAPDAGSEPAWCSPGALTAAIDPLEPGAGNRYAALVLTNTSGADCRTQGWPGLQLATGDGAEIPTTTVRDESLAPAPVTLAPGASAWTRLHWSAVPGDTDPAAGCGPDPAVLQVIPPDAYSPTAAAWELGTVCGAGRIETQPLAEGAGPAR